MPFECGPLPVLNVIRGLLGSSPLVGLSAICMPNTFNIRRNAWIYLSRFFYGLFLCGFDSRSPFRMFFPDGVITLGTTLYV